MKRKLIISATLSAALTACGTTGTPVEYVPMRTSFDAAAHASYMGAGTATIKGQAFLRQNGGGVVTCAGSDVIAWPATDFFREGLSIVSTGRDVAGGIDPAAKELMHFTKCDAQGNFELQGLPKGSWLIGTDVHWIAGYNNQGGRMLREVKLADDQTSLVFLTDADLVR